MCLCGGFPFKNSASSTAHLLCYEQQKNYIFWQTHLQTTCIMYLLMSVWLWCPILSNKIKIYQAIDILKSSCKRVRAINSQEIKIDLNTQDTEITNQFWNRFLVKRSRKERVRQFPFERLQQGCDTIGCWPDLIWVANEDIFLKFAFQKGAAMVTEGISLSLTPSLSLSLPPSRFLSPLPSDANHGGYLSFVRHHRWCTWNITTHTVRQPRPTHP